MKVFLLLGLSFLLFLSAISQHKYYVASKETLEEKKNKPLTSLENLSKLPLQPGDTVFFPSGDVLEGNVSLNNIHGTKEHNIILTSYGKEKSVINGKNGAAFSIAASDFFQIVNVAFIGSGRKAGNTKDGLKLVNCKHAKIRNVEISGFQKSGLICYNSGSIEVNKVFAHDNGFAGILVEGDYQKRISNNIHIVNCRADNNPGDPTNLENHSGNGILVGNCKNVLIEYCTATNNGCDMPRVGNGPVGLWTYEADSVIIQHCISYRNKTAKGAADGGGFDLDGGVTNSIIQYCLSYENWGSGYGIFQYYGAGKWGNNTVRFCISINDGHITDQASGMLIWNGRNGDSTFRNFFAYNNFFYNDKKYAFGFSDQSRHKNFSFFNNVFVSSDSSDIFNGVDSSTNDVFYGNVWMRKGGGFSQNGFNILQNLSKATEYEQQAGKSTGMSFQRRLFAIPLHLNITDPYSVKTNSLLLSLCNSVLRNKGIDIQKLFSIDIGKTDFFGRSISGFNPGVCSLESGHLH